MVTGVVRLMNIKCLLGMHKEEIKPFNVSSLMEGSITIMTYKCESCTMTRTTLWSPAGMSTKKWEKYDE